MFDRVFAFMRIVTTSIDAATKAVLANLDTGQDTTDPDNAGEFAVGQEWFSALGVVGRAKPPGKLKDGRTVAHVEALAVRKGDGMVPIAVRDLRLSELYQAPESAIAFVGYGGAYDANEPTFDGAGNPASSVRRIYVPYAFVGGVATKAHVITVDGGAADEIRIVHGDGTTVLIKAGQVNLGAASGTQPVAIAPNVTSYLTALENLLSAMAGAIDTRLGPAIPTPMATLVTTFTAAQAATKTAMAATKAKAV